MGRKGPRNVRPDERGRKSWHRGGAAVRARGQQCDPRIADALDARRILHVVLRIGEYSFERSRRDPWQSVGRHSYQPRIERFDRAGRIAAELRQGGDQVVLSIDREPGHRFGRAAAAYLIVTPPPLRRLAGAATRRWLGASLPLFLLGEAQ